MDFKLEALFKNEEHHKGPEALNENQRNAAKAIASEANVILHWRNVAELAGRVLDQNRNSFDFGLKYTKLFKELLASTE